MKVFISSLISGCEQFRDAAKEAVTTLRHEPIMAEDFQRTANITSNSLPGRRASVEPCSSEFWEKTTAQSKHPACLPHTKNLMKQRIARKFSPSFKRR
jgi:hypothetical protein